MAAPRPDAQVEALVSYVDKLESARAIKKLQRAFGYYMDRGLWSEAGDLFADTGSVEIGADGVYVGRARIVAYLQALGGGQPGLMWGQLNEWVTLQPVVDVATDGDHAKARWRDIGMLGHFQESATWRGGVYENDYLREGGVWKIARLHLFVNFEVPYEKGWARSAPAADDWRSAAGRALPADGPSTVRYRPFPDPQLAPYHYANPVTGMRAAPPMGELPATDPLAGRFADLRRRAMLLSDLDQIENLQAAYGYYFDKGRWADVAALFTATGSFEYGQRGVYVGPAHIHRALLLFGPEGQQKGWLNEHMQVQPIITVAPDGRAAKARWRGMLQLGRANANGQWGEGTYENEYVKEAGVWKLSRLHFYLTGLTDYDAGWAKSAIPGEGPSAIVPPDRPPTEIYRSFPGVYIPPFDYAHPVTGKPIIVREPADSVLGRK